MSIEDASDRPIVERVGRPYAIEAVRMLEAGEGSVADIDAALESVGYARGPFRLIDDSGLDADLAVDRALQVAVAAGARFDPPPLQVRLVEAGGLGRHSGHGFYRYGVDGSAVPDVAVEVVAAIPEDRIVERLELAIINEAYRMVEEGLASAPSVDRAIRRGLGAPAGPFERVAELGLGHVVRRLHALHAATIERSADQYAVATSLWQMATV